MVVVAIAVGVIIYKVKKSNAERALENPNQNKKQETTITYMNQPSQPGYNQNQGGFNQPPPNYPPNYPPPNYPPQYNNAY